MAITLQLVWGNKQRFTELTEECVKAACQYPYGWEVRVNYADGDRIYNEFLLFKEEPDFKTLETAVLERQKQVEDRVAMEAAEMAAMMAGPEPVVDAAKVEIYKDLCTFQKELEKVDVKLSAQFVTVMDKYYGSLNSKEVEQATALIAAEEKP